MTASRSLVGVAVQAKKNEGRQFRNDIFAVAIIEWVTGETKVIQREVDQGFCMWFWASSGIEHPHTCV